MIVKNKAECPTPNLFLKISSTNVSPYFQSKLIEKNPNPSQNPKVSHIKNKIIDPVANPTPTH